MAEYHLGNGPYGVLGLATQHFPICGHGSRDDTEVNQQARLRFAATLQNLFVRITGNSQDGAVTIRSRVNGANGNLSVSIPASTSGDFEDTVNSDTLATADLINLQYVSASAMGTLNSYVVGSTLDNTDDDRGIVVLGVDADWVTATLDGATTYYFPISGEIYDLPRAEPGEDYTFRHVTTFSELRVFVETNEPTNPSTVRLRVNGANGNLNLSIPGATTGEFEDTVNTDAIAAGDEVNHQVIVGTGGHGGPELVLSIVQMHHDAPDTRVSAAGVSDAFEAQTAILRNNIEGTLEWRSAGSSLDYGSPARFPFDVRNYYLNMRSNSYDAASVFTVREGVADADTALTITVPATSSGRFEDTVNTISVAIGDRLYNEWDSLARTAGSANLTVVGMELFVPVIPPVDQTVSIASTLDLPPGAPPRVPPIKGVTGSGLIRRRPVTL